MVKTDVLLSCIRKEFPELRWQSAKVITEGWDHTVIILDNELVFRFPNEQEYAGLLAGEIDVLKILAPLLEIAVPDYTYVASDRSFAGYPLVRGDKLTPELLDGLPRGAQAEIAQQLARALSAMHTAIQNGCDLSNVRSSYMPDDQANVKHLAEKYLPGVLSPGDMALVREILDDIDTLLLEKTPTVFIHGDVYSRHLLWDDATGKLGLIDFSDMMRGDPAIDFAELYEYGADFVQKVYMNYDGPKDPAFLDRAWQYQRWTGVYMMTDYFEGEKTSFETARETFDRVKRGRA